MVRTSTSVSLVLAAVCLVGVTAPADACDTRQPTRETDSGPHDFSSGVPEPRLWQEGDDGEPLFIRARVLDTCGAPVAGARVRIVHANAHGGHEPDRWRADLATGDDGSFDLVTVLPGYTGGLPRHIHFIIDHPDHPQLVTRLFFKGDPSVDQGIDNLAMVLEKVERNQATGWLGGYEFVLPPK